MPRSTRTDDKLVSASEHLCYEIEMLLGTKNALASRLCQNGILANALIESFTLHARVLLAFLYPETELRKDDVVAEHYVEDWNSKRPRMPKSLNHIRGRVGKEVAHLTYGRLGITDEAKQWNIEELAQELCALFRNFLERAPENKLCRQLLKQKKCIEKKEHSSLS